MKAGRHRDKSTVIILSNHQQSLPNECTRDWSAQTSQTFRAPMLPLRNSVPVAGSRFHSAGFPSETIPSRPAPGKPRDPFIPGRMPYRSEPDPRKP
jgi:hypothetical protein